MAYTTINDPTDYFNTNLWTSSASELNVTGVGFQPDFVWLKSRSIGADHGLWDNVRGVQKLLASNQQDAESTTSGLTSFDSDGFTLGTANSNFNGVAGRTMVGWNWLASNTTASNTDGSITSTVSANTTSGFSIVSYTGNNTAGATVGHGLGVEPNLIIFKNRDSAVNWQTYHKPLGNQAYMRLNTTGAAVTGASIWNSTSPTSSVFTLGSGFDAVNESGSDHIAYCFAEKKGFSKFGSYTGNGSSDGPMIYTGLKPAFVMIKRTDNTASWTILDNKRDPFNVTEKRLFPDTTDADTIGTNGNTDFLSNGIKIRTSHLGINLSGVTYIYMEFAENPFTTSTGIPTTAR